MKEHYKRGGLGDVKIKKFLNDILQELLEPIRSRRNYYENNMMEIFNILKRDTEYAIEYTNETLKKVRNAIGINYFNDDLYIQKYLLGGKNESK
jgi:tryptophanyl-tRNA synthetase